MTKRAFVNAAISASVDQGGAQKIRLRHSTRRGPDGLQKLQNDVPPPNLNCCTRSN